MVFVGVTRFSLFKPDSAEWKTSRAGSFSSPDEYKEFLYSPSRIEPRLTILRDISMPMIAAAAEPHLIRHIIQYSPSLPREYLSELKHLEQQYPFIVLSNVDDVGDTHPYTVANSVNPEQKPYALYRLDDDDLLSSSYFDQLAPLVTEDHLGFRVSLAGGLTGIFDGNEFSTIRYSYHPNIAIGLAGILGRNSGGEFIAPPNVAHNRSDRHGSVIVNAKECSYFWTRHKGQDTDFDSAGGFDATRRGVEALPPVPPEWDILESFPALSGWTEPVTRKAVLSEADVPTEGLQVSLSCSGKFSLIMDSTFPEGMLSNSALISFDVRRGSSPFDGEEIPGMTRSGYSHIGLYRYVATYAGRRSQQLSFELPEGASVRSIKILPFGPNGKPFRIHGLDVVASE